MPHIIVEYTADSLDQSSPGELMQAVYTAVVESQLFKESNIKLRAIPVEHYRLGSSGQGFIHVQCRIHQGRDDAQKQRLSQLIVASLSVQPLPVSVITCEITELHRASYAKYLRD